MFLFLTLLAALHDPLPTPAEIRAWGARLGSDVFRERERASRELLAHGGARLIRRLEASRDPEVRWRARGVREQRRANVLRSMEPWPCIDANWYDPAKRGYMDNSMRYELWRYLERYDLPGVPIWQSYRNATRDWVSDLLDAGTPAWAVRLWLAELRRRDHLAGYDPVPVVPEPLRMPAAN